MAWRFALTSYMLRPTRYLSFSLPAISLTSYSSPRIVPLHTALSVSRRAVLTMPQSSPSCLPPPTSYRPHRWHPHWHRLITVYSTTSRCLCHCQSCANHAIKLAIILATSYSLSSSPCLTRYHPRCVLLALILVASYSLPYSSCLTRSHTRRVLLAIVHAARVLIAILLIIVVLIASCSSPRVHRVVLIASRSLCRVVFANFPLFPTLSNAMRIKNSGD